MKKTLAYLIIIGILSFCFGIGWMFYSQGDMTGALVGLGLGLSFTIFFGFIIVAGNKMVQSQDIGTQDYELVMTQLHYVESLGEDYFYVHTKWVDPDGGAEYFFKSGYINFNPESFLKNREIPVKISIKDYRVYVVDLSMLPAKI